MTNQNDGSSPSGAMPPVRPPVENSQSGVNAYAPPTSAPPGTDYPGKVLGIVGFILAFVFTLAGLVCSIIALVQSRRAGYKNGLALAGVIVSGGLMVIGIIVGIIAFAVLIPAFVAACTSGQVTCS